MSENNTLLSSLKSYLTFIGAKEKTIIPNRCSIWYDSKNDLEIILPSEELVKHAQSEHMLIEAATSISKNCNLSVNDFIDKILNQDSDLLQVRTSGHRIEHGRIKFTEGLSALTGLYGIIKKTATDNIKCKGKKSALDRYLSGVNMLSPKAGSFIYRVELQLVNTDNEELKSLKLTNSLGRYINYKLATSLNRISNKIKTTTFEHPSRLLGAGINESFCNNFLHLFSNSADSLEFDFEWSFKEVNPDDTPSKIVFTQEDRDKISAFKILLGNSKAQRVNDLPAYIEKYSWPIDDEKGRIYLRLNIDNRDHVCFIEADSILYERLKAEHAKKLIFITCDLLITSGAKTSIDVLNVYQIKTDPNQEINFTI